jgi:hypothetical protein
MPVPGSDAEYFSWRNAKLPMLAREVVLGPESLRFFQFRVRPAVRFLGMLQIDMPTKQRSYILGAAFRRLSCRSRAADWHFSAALAIAS